MRNSVSVIAAVIVCCVAQAPVTAGDLIVFAGGADAGDPRCGTDLWTVRTDGSDLKQITHGGGLDCAPKWSPDGARVAFLRCEGAGGVEMCGLWLVDPRGGLEEELLADLPPSPHDVAWLPDGNRLSFSAGDSVSGGLWLVAVESGAMEQIASGPIALHSWSPDGSQVVYDRWATQDHPAVLWMMDSRGQSATLFRERASMPAWSPNGDVIAATEWTIDSAPIGLCDLHSMNWSHLTATDQMGVVSTRVSWSPDGTQLAYEAGGYLWIIQANGDDRRRLMPGRSPSWSPGPGPTAVGYVGWATVKRSGRVSSATADE